MGRLRKEVRIGENRRGKEESGHGRWSGRRGSNPQPTAWEAATLPLSYSRRSPSVYLTREPSIKGAGRTGGRGFAATVVADAPRPVLY